jgi:hypothetical protein
LTVLPFIVRDAHWDFPPKSVCRKLLGDQIGLKDT